MRPATSKAEPAIVTAALDSADLVAHKVKMGSATLSVAESCTGGLIAKLLTDIPGASEWFVGSAVVYSDAAKQGLLGVSKDTLENHTAVSEQCACEMASGALKVFGTTYAISTTGYVGPTGKVGTIYVAIATKKGVKSYQIPYQPGCNRDALRHITATYAFKKLLESV